MQLSKLTLYCNDIDAQRAWYAAHGWDVQEPCVITIGQSQLQFVASDQSYVYHYAIAVPANSIHVVQRWWLATCHTPHHAPYGTIHAFDEWQADAVYFRDAVGNIVEFIAQRDPVAPTPTSFNLSDTLGICEIGIASSAVLSLADWCHTSLHLSAFYATSPSFYPVGDTHGRIIIVDRNRIWYPDTGVMADCTPCQITVQTAHHAAVQLTFTTPDMLPHRT